MILGLKNQTARRFGPAKNVSGVMVNPEPYEFEFKGAIQPLDPKTREALDGGFVARARYILFTTEDLKTIDRGGQTIADQVKHRGQWLEVLGDDDWQDAPFLKHREYILLKPET